jgi:hypothetical protein
VRDASGSINRTAFAHKERSRKSDVTQASPVNAPASPGVSSRFKRLLAGHTVCGLQAA